MLAGGGSIVILLHLVQYVLTFQIHEHMTDEELMFYFGKTEKDQIKDSYDLGVLRKTERNKVFGRIFEKDLGGLNDIVYELFALGERITLNAEKNDLLSKFNPKHIPVTYVFLVSRRANIAYIDGEGNIERRNVNMSKLNCHMHHKDEHMVAAFSNCMDGHIMGFIVTENDTFEVTPLTSELETIARSSIESNKLWRSGDTSGNEIKVYLSL